LAVEGDRVSYHDWHRNGEGGGALGLTYQDLLNVRLAPRPAPLIDVWLAVATVQRPRQTPLFAPRRRRLCGQLTQAARPLADLVNGDGDGPDYLAPATGDLDDGIHTILSTPDSVVRSQLADLFGQRPAPLWIRHLADGDREARTTLVEALRRTHRDVVQADYPRLRDAFDRDSAWRADLMVSQGTAAVLGSIPNTRWTGSVFTRPEGDGDRGHFELDGAGVTLLPSATWTGNLLLERDADGTWLLIYAALDPAPNRQADDPLVALLGRTRAAVLRLLTHPHHTTAIARELGISPATASNHASVLRAAGLVTSQRYRSAILHSCTILGRHLAGQSYLWAG
jgi:DNA-binding transcriptional ArsR family regulator